MNNNFKEAAEEQSFKMKRSGFNDMESGLWKLGFLAGCEHAAPKWIDVNERLPERGGEYHIFADGKVQQAFWFDHWFYRQVDKKIETVTHWQPLLPSPPSIQKLNPEK
jgi:hypothetical protein